MSIFRRPGHICHSAVRLRVTPRQRRSSRYLSTDTRVCQISEEVRQALFERRPVVALESTIYTHGFPYPDNLSLASRLESLVRINGGVPATIGILDGIAKVGMGADELMRLVSSAGQASTLKVSRRDLGFVCGLRDASGKPLSGGTTVSGTMILAHLAGIKVFATGGLGGVHRGAEQTMDISADLTELGRTPVAVISSGCKSFLDIPKTLEHLETQGVAVATFADGREGSVDFPAFYSRDSGVRSPMVLRDEHEAARVIHAHSQLQLQSGLHFANPIPAKHSVPLVEMELAISQALQQATDAGATGSASTPFILAKIKELTGNKSSQANVALVEANVIRGTKVAVALRNLDAEEPENAKLPDDSQRIVHVVRASPVPQPAEAESHPAVQATDFPASDVSSKNNVEVFVAGSLNVDYACDFTPPTGSAALTPEMRTSNSATIVQSLGGVGFNVARAAHLMGARVHLCSAVGDDISGKTAMDALRANHMHVEGVKMLPSNSGSRTSQYIAINDRSKELVMAMADVAILEGTSEAMEETFSNFWLPQLHDAKPSHVVLDANWPPTHLARWLQASRDVGAHVSFEPVSNVKSARLFQLPGKDALSVFPNPSVHLATPNAYELTAMYQAARQSGAFERQDWWEVIDALGIPSSGARVQMAMATSSELVDRGIPQQSLQLLPFIPKICTKLGSKGVLLTQLLAAGDERLTSGAYAPHILSRCVNGTEDTLGVGGVYMRLFQSVEEVKAEEVVSVNGVGDTFAGTIIAGMIKRGSKARIEDMIDLAQRAAVLTLKSADSVSSGLGTLRILL